MSWGSLVPTGTPGEQFNYDAICNDAVYPMQYNDVLGLVVTNTAEKRLLFAVLLEAWRTLRTPGRHWRRRREEAAEWFASTEDDWPFSFIAICETLGINHTAARRHMAQTSMGMQRNRVDFRIVNRTRLVHHRVVEVVKRRRHARRDSTPT